MKKLIFIVCLCSVLSAHGKVDCSQNEDYFTTTEGMLLALTFAVDFDTPELDARRRIEVKDFRLWKYGRLSGFHIPNSEKLEGDFICKMGTRVLEGVTDSFHSKEHADTASKAIRYAHIYNDYLITEINKIKSDKHNK